MLPQLTRKFASSEKVNSCRPTLVNEGWPKCFLLIGGWEGWDGMVQSCRVAFRLHAKKMQNMVRIIDSLQYWINCWLQKYWARGEQRNAGHFEPVVVLRNKRFSVVPIDHPTTPHFHRFRYQVILLIGCEPNFVSSRGFIRFSWKCKDCERQRCLTVKKNCRSYWLTLIWVTEDPTEGLIKLLVEIAEDRGDKEDTCI